MCILCPILCFKYFNMTMKSFSFYQNFNFFVEIVTNRIYYKKIANKQQFNETRYNGEILDIEKESKRLCESEFELSPHQQFVKNFLSLYTPYNSLLLYHGLGSGKTCSAIGVAEEMRDYIKQLGISQRIIIVASPNVQNNFKLQLFDDSKLKLVDGLWNIKSCTGNKLLKEINPLNMRGLSRERVITLIKNLINVSYLFLGYTEFANYIQKKSIVSSDLIKDYTNMGIAHRKRANYKKSAPFFHCPAEGWIRNQIQNKPTKLEVI